MRRLWQVTMGLFALLMMATPVMAGTGQEGGADKVLLDDIGPGWSRVQCPDSVPVTEARACFRPVEATSPEDLLIIAATQLPAGFEPGAFVKAAGLGSTGELFETPGLEVGEGEVSRLGGQQIVTIVMVAGDVGFNLVLVSGAPASDAEALLLDVAQRQQAAVGQGTKVPGPEQAAERQLDALLLTPPRGTGLDILATIDVPSDVSGLRSEARSQAVLDLLLNAPARARIFSFRGVPVVSVSLWEQPYDLFAAAALATFAHQPPDRVLTLDEHRLPNAVGFRLPAGKDRGLVIVFRKGRYFATLIAPSVGPDEAAAVRSLTELAKLQADLLPAGGTTPYFFPSTAKSVVITAGLTTAICGLALGIAPLAAAGRRRRARASAGRAAIPNLGSHDVVDVTERGASLRRRGLVLVIVDLAAVNAVVAGTLGVTGVLRLPALFTVTLIAAGAVGGISFTGWWARSELPRDRQGEALSRELRPSVSGVVPGAIALALLVIGMAVVAAGLAGLAFGPSLSGLQRSERFGVDPAMLNVVALAIGVGLLVAGGFAVRLARMWGRANVRRLRARDPRPPILYLRSFEDDALRLPILVSARRPFLELFAARGSDLFEESIAWQVAPYGPVVAIGRPGRPLRSLGAAREYLPDDVWREGVTARMAAAHAIVVIIGATDGLRWELAEIVSGGHTSKAVFLFPPAAEAVLRERWRFTAEALVASGAEMPSLPWATDTILAAVLDRSIAWRAAVADVRDEATYRAGLDQAMSWLPDAEEGPGYI